MVSKLSESETPTVLVVDDEPSIVRLLNLELSTNGFRVIAATSGEQCLQLFAAQRPDIVLLDLVMPGMGGIEVLQALKKSDASVPVIVISARSNEQTRLEVMSCGADDFVPKPFSPDRVTEAINFLLSEGRGESVRTVVRAGEIEIDLQGRRVARRGQEIRLSRSEWQLLEELSTTPGQPRLHQELLSRVWGSEYRFDSTYLRIWVQRLREKLGDSANPPRIILPYLDVGYRLNGSMATD